MLFLNRTFLALLGSFVLTGHLLAQDAASAFGVLEGTVVDAATGKPTACNVTIVDAQGNTLIEKPSLRGGFRTSGRFSKRVPAGKTRVRLTRGTHGADRRQPRAPGPPWTERLTRGPHFPWTRSARPPARLTQ